MEAPMELAVVVYHSYQMKKGMAITADRRAVFFTDTHLAPYIESSRLTKGHFVWLDSEPFKGRHADENKRTALHIELVSATEYEEWEPERRWLTQILKENDEEFRQGAA